MACCLVPPISAAMDQATDDASWRHPAGDILAGNEYENAPDGIQPLMTWRPQIWSPIWPQGSRHQVSVNTAGISEPLCAWVNSHNHARVRGYEGAASSLLRQIAVSTETAKVHQEIQRREWSEKTGSEMSGLKSAFTAFQRIHVEVHSGFT